MTELVIFRWGHLDGEEGQSCHTTVRKTPSLGWGWGGGGHWQADCRACLLQSYSSSHNVLEIYRMKEESMLERNTV